MYLSECVFLIRNHMLLTCHLAAFLTLRCTKLDSLLTSYNSFAPVKRNDQESILLTWINFNLSMDK